METIVLLNAFLLSVLLAIKIAHVAIKTLRQWVALCKDRKKPSKRK